MIEEIKGQHQGKCLKFCIVVARFNQFVTSRLLRGALECLRLHNTEDEDITIVWVPGSLEIGIVAKTLAVTGAYSSLICLGSVIRGQTKHYDVVVERTTCAISKVSLETGVPIITGILTTDTARQALERAGGRRGNRGYDAAMAAMEMGNLLRTIRRK